MSDWVDWPNLDEGRHFREMGLFEGKDTQMPADVLNFDNLHSAPSPRRIRLRYPPEDRSAYLSGEWLAGPDEMSYDDVIAAFEATWRARRMPMLRWGA